jgi:hypothetical protein
LLFVLLVAFVVSILLHRSRFLFGLLFEDGKGDAVFPSELFSPSSERQWNEAAAIPRIIHQMYRNEDIPMHWREGQQAVRELHPDWEYMVQYAPFILSPTPKRKCGREGG